jgi:hypothetical protein
MVSAALFSERIAASQFKKHLVHDGQQETFAKRQKNVVPNHFYSWVKSPPLVPGLKHLHEGLGLVSQVCEWVGVEGFT